MTHLAPLIKDLAVILSVAGFVTVIFQRIKQPVVLGYVIAGLLVGGHALPLRLIGDESDIRVWAELGVIFLMFSLGLEFSFRKLARVGIAAAITALFEVTCMLLLGYGVGLWMGWSSSDAMFLGAMISISSTTIILKALDELKLRTRRFADTIFAVLIVEDLLAVLILVGFSAGVGRVGFSGLQLLIAAGKLILVVGSWFLAGYFLLPRLVKYVGRAGNDEMLSILSIGLCLLLSVAGAYFGYSVALGAFIMGSILAESTESYRIEELIRPLRDLFAAIFFVSVGMLIEPSQVYENWSAVLIVTAVLMLGKIVAITAGALLTGQTVRSSIQVGFGMAQVGEFSFIIASLGIALGATSRRIYPIAVAVSIITTFATPYLIRISHRFAVWFESKLPLRFKRALSLYTAWAQERKADNLKRAQFFKRAFRWLASGLIVTVAFLVVAALKQERILGVNAWFGWAFAMGISAPFFWSMFFVFKGFQLGNETRGFSGTLFLSRLFAVSWLGLLSLQFFPLRIAIIITASVLTALFVLFHQQLGDSYRWFEEKFLSNFTDKPKSRKSTNMYRSLAPWDAHLVRFKVHPNSEIAGARLGDTDLRGRFGISVVVIHRGLKNIVAPKATEQIFPKDELLVLGTDDQVEGARQMIEKPPGLGTRFHDLSGYELKQVLIHENSPLSGLSLRESEIHTKYDAMIVGLEREDRRILNPSSELVLRAGDILLVVGDADRIERLK